MVRENKEFFDTDLLPWNKIGEGVYEKILSRDDETGAYTRLLKIEPGGKLDGVLVHDFYEEVYIIKGSIVDKTLNKKFTAGMYAFRNPGMRHGPYESPDGFLAIEFRYYGTKKKEG